MHISSLRPLALLLALTACGADDHTDPTGDPGDSSTGDTGTTESDPTEVEPGTGTTTATTTATTTTATTSDSTTEADTTTTTTGPDTTTGNGVADCGFDPDLAYARDATIYQLVSDDGETCVWLERRDDSEPDVIYKAVPYTLLAFRAGHDGAVEFFDEPAQLLWESTHHNWLDAAEAWNTTVRYRLQDRYGMNFLDTFELSAIDEQSDAVLWGPILLHPFTP
jgi:hypothetical protein